MKRKAGSTVEATAWVCELALRVKPGGVMAVRKLAKALDSEGDRELAERLRDLLAPKPPKERAGRTAFAALLKGKSLSVGEKALLKALDETWETRLALEAPATASVETIAGGRGGGAAGGLSKLERRVGLGGRAFSPMQFLNRMRSVELFTHACAGETSATVYNVLHALVRDGVGLKVQEKLLRCRHGKLTGELKWALGEFGKVAKAIHIAA